MMVCPGTYLRASSFLAVAMLLASRAIAQCPDKPFDFFETQGYRVREVRVTGPLIRGGSFFDGLVASTTLKPGAPVSALGIESGKQEIRAALRESPSLFESPVAATMVTAAVEGCDETARQLAISYRVFTTKVPLVLSRTFESRAADEQEPAERLALSRTPIRYRVAPVFRLNASEGFVGGARVSLAIRRVFDRFEADLQASNSAAYADVGFSGSHERETGFLRAGEWHVAYRHADRPTDQQTLKLRELVVQTSAVSRPIGVSGGVFRFASLFEAGTQLTQLPPEQVPPEYIPSAGFASWKNAVGLSLRSQRQALSASYGLQLGQTRGADLFDYVKHVADAAYDGRVVSRTGSWAHRPLDVMSRLAAGRLHGGDGIPVTERFFGGNVEIPFLATDAWTVRGNPVLRSFPAYSFNTATGGPAVGGDSFWSLTVTMSMPVWFRPLVPSEVAEDSEIRQGIAGQLGSAESALETTYKTSDPAHREIFATTKSLEPAVTALQARLATIMPSAPSSMKGLADACADQVDTLLAQLQNVTPTTYLEWVVVEASTEDVSIPSVLACIERLNTEMQDPELTRVIEPLRAAANVIRERIARIDTVKARDLAARDMAFPRQVVNTIFDELNAVSLGPAFLLDAAHIGQRGPPGAQATRYGIGLGVRLSVASSFHVTGGYAWNPDRHGAERPGAGFAVIEFSALFGQ
jgi:hypothetical protein